MEDMWLKDILYNMGLILIHLAIIFIGYAVLAKVISENWDQDDITTLKCGRKHKRADKSSKLNNVTQNVLFLFIFENDNEW